MQDDAELTASVLRFAAQGVLRYLRGSEGWRQLSLAEDQFHTGDDPILADAESHEKFEQSAMTHPAYDSLNVWAIVGEERIVNVPKVLQPGARVFVIDPLDGSSTWAILRMGYCVAALSLLANEGGELEFECAIVADQTTIFTLIGYNQLRFGSTFSDSARDAEVLSTLPENDFVPPSLALTGYKPKDRPTVINLMGSLSHWSIITLGGNPVTPFVVTAGLTAAVTLRSQCTWDAIGILMCTATDAVVGGLDGTVVSGPAFRALFNKIILTGNVRRVPPMVVAKNLDRFKQVAAATEQSLVEGDPL